MLKNVLIWYYSYMTNWILTPFVMFLFGILPQQYLFTLKALVNLGEIGGFYITYIKPRFIYVDVMNIYLSGTKLRALDFITHLLPCLYFNYWLTANNVVFLSESFSSFFLYGIVYLLVNDPAKLYRINIKDIGIIVVSTLLMTKYI